MPDETHLIDQALSGDRSAFTELVRIHQDRLYVSMLHVTGSPDEAEDAVQDAFIRAFLKLHTFQRNSQFFTWLYRIAFNGTLSRRRRKRPNISLDQFREVSGVEFAGSTATVDDDILRREDVDLVRDGLDQVSGPHREILVLREMQEHSYEDIASILEISIGTVRSRLNRARASLKQAIETLQSERDIDSKSTATKNDGV